MQPPLHYRALVADVGAPVSPRVKELLLDDQQRWTRRYIRPFARPLSRALVWLIVAFKRVLPFQFSSHTALDRLSVWFLRRCVSPEGGELLLRHFVVESNLINFIARNCGVEGVDGVSLRPRQFNDLMNHAVIRHDVNMYGLVIQLGESLAAAGRARCRGAAELDFASLSMPEFDVEPERFRLVALDLGTALYFMNIAFALFTNEDTYEQAVNSFQLDEPMLHHLASITGDDMFRAWGAHQSLTWLAINRDVPRDLFLHAVVHEYAHTHLRRLEQEARAGCATTGIEVRQ
jgi:hypothetical protein